MSTISIEVPEEILASARMSAQDARVELAHLLYKKGRISEAQAVEMAGDAARLENLFANPADPSKIEMDEFISWAAHDLKSPLNAIIGFTKVVLKGIDGPVTDLQVTDLTSAHTNGQRMLALTNNLIDMSRLNNGDIRIEMIPGDLSQTLRDAANRWKVQNPARELTASIEVENHEFSFDGTRIRQVTSSLLTYAANHVAEGGKVELTATNDSAGVSVSIRSSGEKARDRYEMDLAMISYISRGLIRLHGGSLELGPDTGHGVEIRFNLPY